MIIWLSDRISQIKPEINRVMALPDDPLKWSDEDILAQDRVSICFQDLAFLVENGLISEKLVTKNWGPSLRRVWSKIKPAVELIRDRAAPSLDVVKNKKVRISRIDLQRYAERLATDQRFIFIGSRPWPSSAAQNVTPAPDPASARNPPATAA
jgi:hypothetical protein